MNINLNLPSRSEWDVFRSKSRVLRAKKQDVFYIHWLQRIKLLIFFVSQCSCLAATLLSKTIVLLLATNIGMQTFVGSDAFNNKCSSSASMQTFEKLSCFTAALWLIQITPDICAFLQDVWYINSSNEVNESLMPTIAILECFRATGLSMLTMTVFPLLDVPRCILLMCAIPSIPHLQRSIRLAKSLCDTSRSFCCRFGLILWLSAYFLLFYLLSTASYIWLIMGGPSASELMPALPLSFIFCSIGYWESWVDNGHAVGTFKQAYQVKFGIRKLNRNTRIVTCVLRCISSTIVFCLSLRHHNVPFGTLPSVFIENSFMEGPQRVFFLSIAAILANFYLRVCFRFLAAMRIQIFNLAHPILICMPFLFCYIYIICYYVPICELNNVLQSFGLNLHCTKLQYSVALSMGAFSDYYIAWVWMAVYVVWSYYFIEGDPIQPSDEFIESMSPMMTGLDICQSLVIFHCAVNERDIVEDSEDEMDRGIFRIISGESDKIRTLYVCATMWHETHTEMIQMIRSIIELDEECAVRMAGKNTSDNLKFRLEVHIFFDDAWTDDKECGRMPNNYYKMLFEILMELTNCADDSYADDFDRMLVNTPYGGRLVMTLGAGSLLFVHLKDKNLVRHKKRWSQVMYMYYLLGHRIMDSHLSVEEKQLQADNTYILAIDGDSKFEPQAVIRLLHLMDVKSDLGCACGRIHPIGEGVMVWYQKFEYAIAHWFQKAAEHVFGCVLCAPGCFSLFRASALMDDNVMHKYTKTASEPRHFVQYDQGEDRWLSTLLLKQGYRIEYAAAADAETYAPEGFDEFFNQRRRWTPSSIANTLDLLADYKLASKNNRSISKLYILYQTIVIGFSLLGPAIIFTMLVYAQVAAFAMDSLRVLVYNAVPVCLFVLSCFCLESGVQLLFAKIASILYAFIMMAVLIATMQQIVLETIFSPTSAFVLAMALIFLSASFVHPKEFTNIIYGAVFFLMIPATYVFMSLYSLINLNVINWGTREAIAKATGRVNTKEGITQRLWKRVRDPNYHSSTIARFLTKHGANEDSSVGMRDLEKGYEQTDQTIRSLQKCSSEAEKGNATTPVTDISQREALEQETKTIGYMNDVQQTTAFDRSLWMDCEYLQNCNRGKLQLDEENFWDELIDAYLKPIETTVEEELTIAKGLATLRNRISFSILLLNALLVLAVFLLQRHKDVLSIQLTPYEGFVWTKLNETTGKFEHTTEALKVDPLGMGIIFFLMGILVVQTIGMLIHRLNTLVEALHELNELGDQCSSYNNAENFKDYQNVLDEARQMIDTASYDRAHGADGYVRSGLAESSSSRNVLYKLEQIRNQ